MSVSPAAATLLAFGSVAHFVADWLLQTSWMAENKHRFGHPAGICHALVHVAALAVVFGPAGGLALGVAHYLIDLRWPLRRWAQIVPYAPDVPVAAHIAIWRDQTLHLACIAGAAALLG